MEEEERVAATVEVARVAERVEVVRLSEARPSINREVRAMRRDEHTCPTGRDESRPKLRGAAQSILMDEMKVDPKRQQDQEHVGSPRDTSPAPRHDVFTRATLSCTHATYTT